jgi:hypothetical protein
VQNYKIGVFWRLSCVRPFAYSFGASGHEGLKNITRLVAAVCLQLEKNLLMNRTRKKRTKPVLEAYDPRLMEQIETQLALAREMTQLATELRVCLAQIERTLRNGSGVNVVRLPERVN